MADGPSEGACLDCKRRYGDEYGFPDMLVSDEVWEQLNPGSNGAGLLCPSCINARAHAAGIENAGMAFVSGPFSGLNRIEELEQAIMAAKYTLTAANKSLNGPNATEREAAAILQRALYGDSDE